MFRLLFVLPFLMLFQINLNAQTDSLQKDLKQLIADKNAVVGIYIKVIETGETITLNPEYKYPLMSVFKLHLGLTVLHLIDKGELQLNQEIYINKSDLLENTWSPIRVKYPEGNIKLTIAELLQYTISESDNNGCDILLKLIGGTEVVNNYMHAIGISDVQIKVNENDMHVHPDTLYANWTKLEAAGTILQMVYAGTILKDSTNNFLLQTLTNTTTGPQRLKGMLPDTTIVAHKTGTSGENNNGVTAAVNDIGIITLPNGNHMIICVFVRNSRELFETNEKIIASVAYAAWKHFGE